MVQLSIYVHGGGLLTDNTLQAIAKALGVLRLKDKTDLDDPEITPTKEGPLEDILRDTLLKNSSWFETYVKTPVINSISSNFQTWLSPTNSIISPITTAISNSFTSWVTAAESAIRTPILAEIGETFLEWAGFEDNVIDPIKQSFEDFIVKPVLAIIKSSLVNDDWQLPFTGIIDRLNTILDIEGVQVKVKALITRFLNLATEPVDAIMESNWFRTLIFKISKIYITLRLNPTRVTLLKEGES